MISVEEATEIIRANVSPLPVERVLLSESLGRVLAIDVIADSDLPPFNRAQMDGYAIRAADSLTTEGLKVVGESAAGKGWHNRLGPGEAVRIMTGAPVPEGADSVQRVEVTREESGVVTVFEPTKPGQFIVPHASEVKRGEVVCTAGQRITPAIMATLASFGYWEVPVRRPPGVSILATGSELVNVKSTPGPDQIRDSNSFSISGYTRLAGGAPTVLNFAGDQPSLLRESIESACSTSDVLVLSGGVSMGDYDFTKPVLKDLGTRIFFERVALRPGKPTVFGKLANTLVFGLPGNPVSVSVTFNLFVRIAILRLQGSTAPALRSFVALLGREVRPSPDRTSYLPAVMSSGENGELIATPLKWGGSSDFVAFAKADSLIIVPPSGTTLAKGQSVTVAQLPGI
jgi:molybdopterin molybdotransferase